MKPIKCSILSVAFALSALTTFADAPIITSQPVGAVVELGQAAGLSVSNVGTGPFGYQWLKDGVILPGRTSQTLTYANFQFTNSGSYQVVITNADGLVISFPASLSLSNAPLRVWGDNGYGQLGNGTRTSTNRLIVTASNVVAVAGGHRHSLFVKADGTLWAMGWNLDGQLGNGTTTDSTVPILVTSNVVAVAAGEWHSLFVRTDGTLWAMGNNDYGQLGNGTNDGSVVPIVVASNVVAAACGSYHSLFVRANGTLWAMGDNYDGQLGNGTTANANSPVSVASNVVAVAGGSYHSLFVKADGTVWTMGLNNCGQLGNGRTVSTNRPVMITTDAAAVAGGSFHSLFMKADGSLWGMGYNYYGQLGTNFPFSHYPTNIRTRPIVVASNVVAVAGGSYHSLFVKEDDSLWAMGYNSHGQLGNGMSVNANWPVLVSNGGLITASLAKEPMAYHSLAVAAAVPVVALTDQTVNLGQPVSLTPSVSGGDGPFTYQWQQNGTNLVAATNATCTIANAVLTDAGNYTVIVTGPFASASASATLVVNREPTASALVLGALTGEPQTLKIIGGAHPPFDPDGDPLAVVAVTEGVKGATVTQDGINITYTSAELFTGTDIFYYVVGDGHGLYAANTVTVTVIPRSPDYNLLSLTGPMPNGSVQLTFAGIPHGAYALEWATNLTAPIDWLPLATNSANAAGALVFTNSPVPSINNFWRVRFVP
jgi:hypothetical protein